MGHYINPSPGNFKMCLNSKIHIDKTNLIAETNHLLGSEKSFVSISRPRRFGKTMSANMVAAYYGKENTQALFDNMNIAKHQSYKKHLNKYNVIMVRMTEFLSITGNVIEMLGLLRYYLTKELKDLLGNSFRSIKFFSKKKQVDTEDFIQLMKDTYRRTKCPFVIVIDQGDCVVRECRNNVDDHKLYLDFLNSWLKDQSYIGLVYMIGVLPIKKYGSHSALRMFDEYSMTKPGQFLNYFGFTETEVEELVAEYEVDMDKVNKWYNGYFAELGTSIFNPISITRCLNRGSFYGYWNRTETHEALQCYFILNFADLKEKVVLMLAGESVAVETENFSNDMTTFNSADDVLTLLVHLGYLTYDFEESTVRIPNGEVKNEFIMCIEGLDDWRSVMDKVRKPQRLSRYIWSKEIYLNP